MSHDVLNFPPSRRIPAVVRKYGHRLRGFVSRTFRQVDAEDASGLASFRTNLWPECTHRPGRRRS
ncbi:hypothetical protein [Kitasatospora herbaricolor]|uniref:hypothetical protein n=1 Tax=Kitasatospora herbaricolor TaxID=68217 RepID=UPI0036DCA20A